MRKPLDRLGIRRRWTAARKAEAQYNSRLRSLARTVGEIVKGLDPDGSYSSALKVARVLQGYSDVLAPWAESVAGLMLQDVSRRDETAWREHARHMSRGLRKEILEAPTGQVLAMLQRDQVELIKSIPLEAAKRVHEIATGQLYTGARPTELMREILRTTEVTEARARLIARTETSRAASNLLEARSLYVGSEGYIWRTAEDGDVRPSHKKMEGKYVRWGQPPTLDKMTGHAGCLPNCRCWAEPVLPDMDAI